MSAIALLRANDADGEQIRKAIRATSRCTGCVSIVGHSGRVRQEVDVTRRTWHIPGTYLAEGSTLTEVQEPSSSK